MRRKKKKTPPSTFEDGAPSLRKSSLRFALASERLVASRAAGRGGGGLLFHGYELGGLRGHGNGEDVIGRFNPAKEVLVAHHLEAESWLVFASGADFSRKQQHTLSIFKAADGQHAVVAIVCATDLVGACRQCFPRNYKVVGDVDNYLILGLGPGGSSESGQPKKCGQDSDVNRFH